MYSGKGEFCSDEELRDFMKTDGNRLIWTFICKYGKTLDREEAYQEAMIAVAKALASCREEKTKTKKTTYVCQALYNQIKMLLREDSTKKRILEKTSIPLESLKIVKDSFDVEERVIGKIDRDDRSASLYAAIAHSGLSYDEHFVIQARLRNQNQTDTAKMLGCSQSYVSKKLKSAMKKIRSCLLDADWDGHTAYFFDCHP